MLFNYRFDCFLYVLIWFHGLVGLWGDLRGKKHKFHGLVGPPAAIFEKDCSNLQNQEGHFSIFKKKK